MSEEFSGQVTRPDDRTGEEKLFPGASVVPSVGEMLKAARVAKAWSEQEAGAHLRLMARQIEAMEADDFASLGQPVFARGFVRNYAKLLGLDADLLLANMSPVSAPVSPQPENLPFSPQPGFWKSPWVIGAASVALLILAVPVVLYLWLNSAEDERTAESLPPERVNSTEAMPASAAMPSASAPSASAPSAGVVSSAPSAQPELQLSGGLSDPNQPVQPEVPASTTLSQLTVVPASPAPVADTKPTPATVVAPATPATAVSGVVPPVHVMEQTIQFRMAQPAWLEVRDSTGKVLHSALDPAGSAVNIKGLPPFSLVVGNAANVLVSYKNKPVDIKPYIDVTVARFTLK